MGKSESDGRRLFLHSDSSVFDTYFSCDYPDCTAAWRTKEETAGFRYLSGPLGYSGFEQSSLNSFGEETVDERQDMEKTIDESGFENYDDERTVDGFSYKGIKLRFKITFEGQTKVVERTLVDQLTLGRGDNCDIDVVLQSTSEERKLTSRLHASIINRPDGLYVRDEGARNKTYINGVEVDGERPLRDEDVLQLGNAMIQIKILQV